MSASHARFDCSVSRNFARGVDIPLACALPDPQPMVEGRPSPALPACSWSLAPAEPPLPVLRIPAVPGCRGIIGGRTGFLPSFMASFALIGAGSATGRIAGGSGSMAGTGDKPGAVPGAPPTRGDGCAEPCALEAGEGVEDEV